MKTQLVYGVGINDAAYADFKSRLVATLGASQPDVRIAYGLFRHASLIANN